jgi:hypothetical protein
LGYIKANHRWKTSFTDWLIDNYIWTFGLLGVIFLIFIFLSKESLGLKLTSSLLLLCGTVGFYFVLVKQRIEHKFKVLEMDNSNDLETYLEKLNWKIETKNNEFIVASSRANLSSLGETITLIFDDQRVLFNSRYVWYSSPKVDRNKLNYERLAKLIEYHNQHSS